MTDAMSPIEPGPRAAGTKSSARSEGARVLGLLAGSLLLRSALYAFESSDTCGPESSSLDVSHASAVDGWIRLGLALAVCVVSASGMRRTTLGLVGASALAWLSHGPLGGYALALAAAGLALGFASVVLRPSRRATDESANPRRIHVATMVALAMIAIPVFNVVLAHTAQVWAIGRSRVNDRIVYGLLFPAYVVTLVAIIPNVVPGCGI